MARVLIIEPDKILSELYEQALTGAGHEVAVVADAQSALDEADERTPDVVVLELQLPEHDGISFLYEFRSYPEWVEIPAIINSYASPQSMEQVVAVLQDQLGATHLFYKPRLKLRRLVRAVQEATEGKPPAEPPQA